MDEERRQQYLEELVSYRETPDAADLADLDPALIGLASAISGLTHPVVPPAVDARYQDNLLAGPQPIPLPAEPTTPNARACLQSLF
jgi:hypothetical protein